MLVRNILWPDDQDAILDHLHSVHGPDDFETLAAWYGDTPTFDPDDCFVIDGENEIAAHAMIVSRYLQIGDSTLPTAEIGVFGVLEPYQDQGLEYELLDVLHRRMTERGDALGLNFGAPHLFEHWQYDYAVGLYLTHYESAIPTELALKAGSWDLQQGYDRRTADRLRVHNRNVTVRRFYLNDLPAIQALYAAESACGHYMMARDEEAWKWQIDYLTRTGRNDPDDFLVAEIDGRLVGYVRLVTQVPVNLFLDSRATRFSVIEAGGIDPNGIEALLGHVARTAQALDIDRIGLYVHPESAFMRHALVHGATLRAFTGAGALRLHDLGQTLYHFSPTLEARRLNSPFVARAYHLIVTTEHDQGEVYLGMGDPEIVELEVPSTSFVRLLTGWYGIDHLATGYHQRYTDLLRALFPRRTPMIGIADLL
jgi:predicted N-acetyltransferase YhbS